MWEWWAVGVAGGQTKFGACPSAQAVTTGPQRDTGGGLVEGFLGEGQTFDCQVQVPVAGTYPLDVRAMCGASSCGSVHFVYPAGTRDRTVANIPYTGPWSADTYSTVSARTVGLPQGTRKIRLRLQSPSFA